MIFFAKGHRQRKQPAHAPGWQPTHHPPQTADHPHAHGSPPPLDQRGHRPCPPSQTSLNPHAPSHPPPRYQSPAQTPINRPPGPPPQYARNDCRPDQGGHHPSQPNGPLHAPPSPPEVTVSPPPPSYTSRPATSPQCHHPSDPYLPFQPDPYAASQHHLPFQPDPRAVPAQQYAPPASPEPPVHPPRPGLNSKISSTLKKPHRLASQSFNNLNESYNQRKKLASQSVTNLNQGLDQRVQLASQSVSNLNQGLDQRVQLASQSVSNLNQGLDQRVQLASQSVSNLNDTLSSRTNQYIAHTMALCDLMSSKLDAIITSIDDEAFSGNEQELVIHEYPSAPQPGGAIENGPVARGNNQALAVAASHGNHFGKVWLYANSRLPPHLPPLKVYIPTYPLLCLAAQYSEKVYHKPTGAERETHVEPDWRHGTKAMVIKSVPVDDMNTVVFAIRGSAGFMDWAVNFRPAPALAKDFLDDPGNLVHSGFLYVARKMVAPVAARLQSLLSENPNRATCSLLITGHSAGGAVAALLYAHMMSTTVKSDLNRLTSLFKRVHCVTFGAPPISLLPIQKPESDRKSHKKSLFFSFINEGDPVARADKEVIKNLLRIYATAAPGSSGSTTSVQSLALQSSTNVLGVGKKSKRPKQDSKANSWSSTTPSPPMPVWNVPAGTLSCAGRLVLLRERPAGIHPGSSSGGEQNVEACVISDDQLRGAVFGDPMCHMMRLYARRIEVLATRAVTAGGMG